MDETDGSSAEVDRPRSDTMSSQDSGIGSQDLVDMLEETELTVGSKSTGFDLTKFSRSMSLDQSCKSHTSSSGVSSMDTSDLGSLSSLTSAGQLVAPTKPDLCEFCQARPKNASFVHGLLGHQVKHRYYYFC